MQLDKLIKIILTGVTLCGLVNTVTAQGINLWRGSEIKADWNDAYKWRLKHIPTENEAVHFRQNNSTIVINRTVELNNGMQLYGQELFLEGNGNINLWSSVPHQRTIYVPASASGYANLTLRKNLSINGRVSLAAKAFGTSASKGSVTLKDRTTIKGSLSIGNDGRGSGKVFIHNKSVYHITEIELHTQAEKGGAAEIHILGGTALMETKINPFNIFLEDSSRKIIIGDYGTLRITFDLPLQQKKEMIAQMITQKHIIPEQGCKLLEPIYQNNWVLLKAECTEAPKTLGTLLAKTSPLSEELKDKSKELNSQPKQSLEENDTLGSPLLSQLKSKKAPAIHLKTHPSTLGKATRSSPVSGYIVFLSAALFLMRPAKTPTKDSDQKTP